MSLACNNFDNWFWAGCITLYICYDFWKIYWLRKSIYMLREDVAMISEEIMEIRQEMAVDLFDDFEYDDDDDDDDNDDNDDDYQDLDSDENSGSEHNV